MGGAVSEAGVVECLVVFPTDKRDVTSAVAGLQTQPALHQRTEMSSISIKMSPFKKKAGFELLYEKCVL